MAFNYCDQEIDRLQKRIISLQGELGELKEDLKESRRQLDEANNRLEIERMRLAACGTAALGYFTDCHDDYKSASLDDVLREKVACLPLPSHLLFMIELERLREYDIRAGIAPVGVEGGEKNG